MAEDSLVLKSDDKGFTKTDLKGDKSSPSDYKETLKH